MIKKILANGKVREGLRYIIIGVTTTVVNIGVYQLLVFAGIDYRISNLFALILCKVYAFFANKYYVFKSHCSNLFEAFKELVRYIFARGFTGLIDYFGLMFAVEILSFDEIISKYVLTIMVIVINYFLGKKMVFREADEGSDLEEQKMEYNDGNLKKYQTKNPLKRILVNRLNEKIISSLKELTECDSQEVKLLDAGCGEGFISRLVAQNFDKCKIVGLEYTEEAIEAAKEFGETDRIEYVRGDITCMPFEDDSFDYVICTEVLEHIPSPERAIKEIERVCKKGMVITVPKEPWFCLGNLLVLKNVSRLGNPIDHVNHWTFGQFKRWLKSHLNDSIVFTSCVTWTVAEVKRQK